MMLIKIFYRVWEPSELATKLCAVSTSEATNDRLPLLQTVQAQSQPAFDVASSERSKEVELESRVDATEQRSNANILLCSGTIISEVIGADFGDLKNKVILVNVKKRGASTFSVKTIEITTKHLILCSSINNVGKNP